MPILQLLYLPERIGAKGVAALTVDANNGNVWAPSQNAGTTYFFTPPFSVAPTAIATGNVTNYAAAIDKNDDVWITGTASGLNGSSLFKASHLNPTGTPSTINATVSSGGSGLDGSRSLMIDGGGRIFISSSAAGAIVEYDPSLPAFLLTAAGNGFNPSLIPGVSNSGSITANGARSTAIDASGALWTVNAGSFPVVQILGIAAPTVSVLAQGKYGTKP